MSIAGSVAASLPATDLPLALAISGAPTLLALGVTLHSVLYKKDSRAAVSWILTAWLLPYVGPALYFVLGINRVERRGHRLRSRSAVVRSSPGSESQRDSDAADEIGHDPGFEVPIELRGLQRLAARTQQIGLCRVRSCEVLETGERAYERMLAAIDAARRSITFMTYIYDDDRTGMQFAQALIAAHRRGVIVQCLVDDVGSPVLFSRALRALRSAGVAVEVFHPTIAPTHWPLVNLRNHRKLMIVDAKVAFTGGMNISSRHVDASERGVRDLHFELTGEIVTQLQEVFADDWQFSTGCALDERCWSVPEGAAHSSRSESQQQASGAAAPAPLVGRALADGPYGMSARIRSLWIAALASARERVCIVTPYFLPDPALILMLANAALRGVQVQIVLPARSDAYFVDRATRAMLWQVLIRGCRVWESPAPFDHSKLMLVDDAWLCVGSCNWDPRSLRLNFELNIELYALANEPRPPLFGQCSEIFATKRAAARELKLADVDARSLPLKIWDGTVRLLSPYL